MNWNKQFKLVVRESETSMAKHLVIKALIILILKEKYKKDINYQEIYSEFPINRDESIITDIYHRNTLENKITCYEVQKENSKQWTEQTTKKYNEINNVTLIIVELKKLSDDINKLVKQLKEIVI